MKGTRILIILLFISTVSFAGCNRKNQSAADSTQKDITVAQLKEQMQSNPDLLILDVRTKGELTGELPKIESAINIPLQELEGRIDDLKNYKNRKIAVICKTGRRSSVAYGILKKNGFNVENVLGGMKAYLQK